MPDAIPSFAESDWITIDISTAATTTHTNRKPYSAPAAMFVAKLPGST